MELFLRLEELRLLLNNPAISQSIERTSGLLSAMGENCQYYRKSSDLFLRDHYDRVKKAIDAVSEQISIIEGPNDKEKK